MPLFRRAALVLLALVLLAGGVAVVKREELLRLWTVNTLFDEGRIVANFSDMGQAFLTVPVSDGPAAPLPEGRPMTLPPGAAAWIEDRAVTGLVVLHDGEVVHEAYRLGTGPEDRRVSWSLAKTALMLLTGILVQDGKLKPSDPVIAYVPGLKGSAYDEATVEDVLQMESGVLFDEDYMDPDSDINRMGRTLALGGSLDDFTASLRDSWAGPGEAWRYVSMDTHVLGMVLRGATGRTIPDLMAERLAGPMGLGPSSYLTDSEGAAFVLGGLNMATRDYARLGQLIADGGRVGDRQVVPSTWIDAATVPSAVTRPGEMRYGYQLWMPADARPGEVLAQGIYGQLIYVDSAANVVIAVNAADRRFAEEGRMEGNIAMLRTLAAVAARGDLREGAATDL